SWGISKLEYLMTHDKDTVGHVIPGDPTEREIQLHQEDGSTVPKKFYDCSSRELRLSNQLRKKAHGSQRPGPATSPRDRAPAPSPQNGIETPIKSLAMLALGIILTVVSEFLPDSLLTSWMFVIGLGLVVVGGGMLIRHGRLFLGNLLTGFFKKLIARVR